MHDKGIAVCVTLGALISHLQARPIHPAHKAAAALCDILHIGLQQLLSLLDGGHHDDVTVLQGCLQLQQQPTGQHTLNGNEAVLAACLPPSHPGEHGMLNG